LAVKGLRLEKFIYLSFVTKRKKTKRFYQPSKSKTSTVVLSPLSAGVKTISNLPEPLTTTSWALY